MFCIPDAYLAIYFLNKRKDIDMEKEMLVLGKFKSGEGKFEKFMGWMQSDEGMAERKKLLMLQKLLQQLLQTKVLLCLKSQFITKKL